MDDWLQELLAQQRKVDPTEAQKLALAAGIDSGTSMVVCAPTSSGKTLIGEIAMLAGIRRGSKALYLVSHKALADQKYEDFFLKYGPQSNAPQKARVAVSTGDREEGDGDPDLMVATYEKALALVISDSINVGNTVVVADELQLIGEDKRGPEVELLCGLLRSRHPAQFVALTATIKNGDDLAGWLDCKLVQTGHRDVKLIQEVWLPNAIYSLEFGQSPDVIKSRPARVSTDTVDAISLLLQEHRGPILVFVETRRDATELATEFASRRTKSSMTFDFAQQMDLFSEGTEFSDRLKESAASKVAFHTADLTPSERRLVEQGLASSDFDVCFATPTLAAGVNFPFQTVVFDRIRRRFIPPPLLPIGSYRNMSGRAGRLGLHDVGYAVLLPRDNEEREHANLLINDENERLFSKLATMSIRKIALWLVASKIATTRESLKNFLEQTLFWYQVRDRNPTRLDDILSKLESAVEWLEEAGMVCWKEGTLTATDVGIATAKSGLLPSSAQQLAKLLSDKTAELESSFEDYELALIHTACCSDEFDPETGQRFLPQINPGTDSSEIFSLLRNSPLFESQRTARRGANNAAVAVFLFSTGELERRISSRTGIPSGQVHRFSGDIAWILDGMHKLAAVSSLGCSQQLMNRIGILARRVRMGVPKDVVDILSVAQKAGVPGFGRQRAVAMRKARLVDRNSALNAGLDRLEQVLGNRERAAKLYNALQNATPDELTRAKAEHLKVAQQLGLATLVSACYDAQGSAYAVAIQELLATERDWTVERYDHSGPLQILCISFKGRLLALACATDAKTDSSLGSADAFAIRELDIAGTPQLATLGRPKFDLMAKARASVSSDVTLVEHSTLIDAILLRRKGGVSTEELFEWLCEPGVSEIDRLSLLAQ